MAWARSTGSITALGTWISRYRVHTPEIFAHVDGKANFTREAETWINLGLHPQIVTCYYVRTLGDLPRIFTEYVDGGSGPGVDPT